MPPPPPVDDLRMVADGDFAWAGSPSEPAAQPPPARRRSRVAPLLAAVAIGAVVTVALVMASGHGTTPPGTGPVALAAAVTSREAGFHTDMAFIVSASGKTVDVDLSGSVSERQPLSGSLAITVAGKTVNEILLAPYVYVQLPNSSSWLRSTFESSSLDTGDSPAQTLNTLRAAGTVTRIGSEAVDGVPATHYHVVVDLDRVADATPPDSRSRVAAYAQALQRLVGSSNLPMDVWVDAQDRVRRIEFDLTACTREGTVTESAQIDYSDFGPQPPVSAPPADEVSDLGQAPNPVSQLNSIAC
jgi:hypothetical protein